MCCEHLLAQRLHLLVQSDWLSDRGQPVLICLRAARRKGRAVFPHLRLSNCQHTRLMHSAMGQLRLLAGDGQRDDGRTELRRWQGNPWSDRCGWGCGRSCWCPEQEACAAGRCLFGCTHKYGWGWTTLLGQPLALQQDRALTCLPHSVLLKQTLVLLRFPRTLMTKIHLKSWWLAPSLTA